MKQRSTHRVDTSRYYTPIQAIMHRASYLVVIRLQAYVIPARQIAPPSPSHSYSVTRPMSGCADFECHHETNTAGTVMDKGTRGIPVKNPSSDRKRAEGKRGSPKTRTQKEVEQSGVHVHERRGALSGRGRCTSHGRRSCRRRTHWREGYRR